MTGSLIRIHAILNRHLLLTFRTVDRVLNIVYWPLITLVVWGGNLIWMEQQASLTAATHAVFFSMILWQIVYRVSIEVANSLMEELLSRNLVNLFSTPATLYEWICAIMILGCINMILIGLFGSAMLFMLFKINILSLGNLLALSLIELLLSGLATGFVICAVFITWGRAVRDFMHALVWILGVFSAMYYPLSVMPKSAQYIARLLPTSYIFESIRMNVQTGIVDWGFMAKGFGLSIVFLFLSIFLFVIAFNHSKQQGLARLE